MEKYSYAEWQKLSKQLTETKDNVEELSKLYIVVHEKVRTILRKSYIDFTYDPEPDCREQLEFIKKILDRLDEKKNDEYLSTIDPQVLRKYQHNFIALVQMIKQALLTNQSKINVRPQLLKRIKQSHHEPAFSLKDQVRASEQRMKRTKSGQKYTKTSKLSQYDDDIPQKDVEIDTKSHVKKIEHKQSMIEKMMNSHIEKQGQTVNFRKKYENLDIYMNQRKQFADLFFCQQFYDNLAFEQKTKKQTKQQKKQPQLNKIFPQFNIKTKFLKPQVKQNILNVIYDVKRALLKDYHERNIKKIVQQNQGIIEVNQKVFNKKPIKSVQSETTHQEQDKNKRFRSTNRPINKFRQSMKSLKTTARTTQLWDEHRQKKCKVKIQNQLLRNKVPLYKH